jgi:glycosyltransferase involved in cell wall biosynthesis
MHVTWGLSPGGTENLLVDVANEQVKSASVAIMIINNNIADSLLREIDSSIEVYRVNRKLKSKNIIYLLKIVIFILKARPNVLHLHHYGLYRLIRFVKLMGIPTCLTVHSTHYPCVHLDKHRQIFAISETVRRDLFNKCKVKSKTILNGINIETIRKREDTRWDGNEPFRIVQISRLHHTAKGQHLLLFALRKLIDDFQISNFTVDFIGTGESQDLLQGLMQKLQLQRHCRFLGELPRRAIYNKLADYHLLVQPSLWEGFGLTMIEAMAAKVPVLASDIDAPREILQDGVYGCLFKNNDPDDLAQKLKELIEDYNQAKVQMIIQEASSYVINNFNVKTTTTTYINNYFT